MNQNVVLPENVNRKVVRVPRKKESQAKWKKHLKPLESKSSERMKTKEKDQQLSTMLVEFSRTKKSILANWSNDWRV